MIAALGREVVVLLPDEDDFFVLKPMHSGFYSTTLGVLLEQLGSKRLILCGFVAAICVLYTANDAYMRGWLPKHPSGFALPSNTSKRSRKPTCAKRG